MHRWTCIVALLGLASCGLDRNGELPLDASPGQSPLQSADAGDEGIATLALFGSGAVLDSAPDQAYLAPQEGDAQAASRSLSTDGSVDTMKRVDSSLPDAGPDSGGEDAATPPCAELQQCCGNLSVDPPLAEACLLSAQIPDGGDPGSCVSSLALLRDSGVCP